ncbi:right-handed parallel beta-helix repeat-containing protein [Actinoplanes sp. M2I2]|uniref:right-handed parallel beta-helix repeat-containing protein n=1 Tax=Actinoplanes sp. M2I2 TaxID=1734444 RepID=UPI0020209B3C|nr:right-handed parallel beta-helix repeat-containing protein [Actinoplanes sp. M2I2]
MPSSRLRRTLAVGLAAVAIPLGGALAVTTFSPTETVAVSTPVTPGSTPATTSPAPPTVSPRLGPAESVTSPPPKPSATPDNGIHVDCEKGDDGNKGTLARPLRSIRAATSRALDPGAVIELARGCTWQTTVQLRGDGTRDKPIRLTAYGAGAQPVVDGGSAGAESVVLLSGAYQIVENIRVTDAETNGVEIRGANSSVRSSTVDHTGVGVLLKARGASAERVTVRDLHMVRDTPGGDDDYGAIGFSVEASDVEVSHSSCTNCRDTSHDYGYDGGFVEVWNYADNLDVHDNTGSNTQGILEIGGDRPDSSARGIKLRDNTFRDTHGGLVLHTDGNFAIGSARIAITGNTITSAGAQDPPILDGDLSNVTFEGNTVSTASFVSHSAPSRHRCNSITLRGDAEVGYQRDSTETLNGRATCS